MISRVEFPALRATACGSIARRLLRDGGNGRVAAVFERSFYIRSADDLACIGNASLLSCPLNVITDACSDMDWCASGLRVGTLWLIFDSTIYLGHDLRIRFGDARTWQPVRVSRGSCRRELNHALATLRRLAKPRVPDEGLGVLALPCLRSPTKRPLLKMAREPVDRLRHWLAAATRGQFAARLESLQPVRLLIGLGPGLTPSGDDFLAGVMIALHAFGREDISHSLWDTIRPWALEAGNIISFAHLSAASEGQGVAPIHCLLCALLTGDCSKMVEHLNAIDKIGHTSGWDALAGVLTAADALSRVEREQRATAPPSVAA